MGAPKSRQTPVVDSSLIHRLADLARLELSAEEARLFTEQLEKILGYVAILEQAPGADEIEPLFHPFEEGTPLREDVARPASAHADGSPRVLDSAPETAEGGYKVPQIL